MKLKYIIRHILLLFLIPAGSFSTWAQQYAVSDIAPELLENAIAVVREYHTEMEVNNQTSSTTRQKTAITILEARGLALADIQIARDSFRRLKILKANLFDGDGNHIRTLGEEEVFIQSLNTGYSVYSDIEFLTTDIRTNQYPFTIEYIYEVDASLNYLNNIWIPVEHLEVSVENASLRVITPGNMSFRHTESGEALNTPEITETAANKRQHQWQLTQFPAIKSEPYMPRWFWLAPFVLISPNEFYYGGYAGNMESWEEFGHWINKLNKGRQRLPARTRREIRNLTQGLTDTLEIINRVHQYVQENTRYVSINLGIGGFQPQSARQVLRDQYGDCKALSSLTQALLAQLGIQSFYTLILSGDEYLPVNPDFPHNYFNHAILCIPLARDTVWLETTISHFPAGYLGSANSSRHVLLITPGGGVLARTPEFVQHESRVEQHTLATLQPDGHAAFQTRKTFIGLNFEDRSSFGMYSPLEQREFLLYNTELKDMKINHLEYIFQYTPEPVTEKNAEIEAFHYLRRAGNRYLLQPVVLHEEFPPLPLMETRISPLELGSSGVYSDIIQWHIPENFTIPLMPEDVNLDTPYGEYKLTFDYIPESRLLSVNRHFLLKSGFHTPDHYNEFAGFLRTVYQKDRTSLFIVPEQSAESESNL